MKPLHIISFFDGRPGHEKQTQGILQALSRLTPTEVETRLIQRPSLPGSIQNWARYLVSFETARNKTKRPVDLIIGTGSSTHIPMLLYQKTCRAKVVTCMSPGFPLNRRIDLCFVPQHDRKKPAANRFFTVGPPNNLVYQERHDKEKALILIGGVDVKSHRWRTDRVVAQVGTLLSKNPSLAWTISSSPRTPDDMLLQIDKLASQSPNVDFFRSEETPAGWIEARYAQSDIVWVTADSISMIYEALTAGCRVGALPMEWKQSDSKFQRSLDYLVQNGHISLYETWVSNKDSMVRGVQLDEASRCAKEILKRWWIGRLP